MVPMHMPGPLATFSIASTKQRGGPILQSSVRLRHEHLEEHCRMATPRSSRLHWRVRHHHNTAERVILPDGRLGLEEIPGTAGT